MLNRDENNCQPCDDFAHKGPPEFNAHECPGCGGVRYFCANCCSDHHKGGWQTCPANGARAKCQHPACIAAEAEQIITQEGE